MVTLRSAIAGNQVDLRLAIDIFYTNATYSQDIVLLNMGEFSYGNDNDDSETEVMASQVEFDFSLDAATHTSMRTIINLLTMYEADVYIYMTPAGGSESLYFRGSIDRMGVQYMFERKACRVKALDSIFKHKDTDITDNNWQFILYADGGQNNHYPAHYWLRTAATNNRLSDGFYTTLATDSTIALRSAATIGGAYKYGTLSGLNNAIGDPVEWYIALRNTYYFLGEEALCPKTIARTLKSIANNLCCNIIPYHSGRIYLQQRFPAKGKVAGSTLIPETVILGRPTVRVIPAKKGVDIKVLKCYYNSDGGGVYDIAEDTAQSISIRGNYASNEIEETEIMLNRHDYVSGNVTVAGLRLVGYEQEAGTDVRLLTAYQAAANYIELVGETTYYSSIADLFYRKLFLGELSGTRFVYDLVVAGTGWAIENYYRLPYDSTKVYRVRRIAFDYIKNETKLSLVEFRGTAFTFTEEETPEATVDDIIMTEYL